MSTILMNGVRDLRRAARGLRRSPLFTLGAVATLGLALGASTALFAVAKAVLFAPLPFPEPQRLVNVATIWRAAPSSVSPPNFVDVRDRRDLFTFVGAEVSSSVALSGAPSASGGAAEQLQGAEVSGEFFRALGGGPALGRLLEPEDSAGEGRKVVVVSRGLWTRRFGADPALLGRTIQLAGEPYEVVGIARAGAEFPRGTEVWTPLVFPPDFYDKQRGAQYLKLVGRLAPGVSLEQADAEVRAFAARLKEKYPQNLGPDFSLVVRDLRASLVARSRPTVVFVGLAVGLVLLIACANVANLLTARAVERDREFALRAALGAGRGRLAAQVLAESLLLCLAGAAAGFGLAWFVVNVVAHADIPLARIENARLDGPAWIAAALLAVLGALVTALPSTLSLLRQKLTPARLAASSERAGEGRRAQQVRHGLTALQIALATSVLALGGLLGKSLLRLASTDLGLRPEGAMTFSVSLPDRDYRPVEKSAAFAERLNERLRALPGVEASGAIFGLPLSGFGYSLTPVERDGQTLETAEQERLTLNVRVVTPDFFRALGTRLVAGRALMDSDRAGSPPAVLLNEAAASLLWPEVDAIGRRVVVGTRLGLGGERLGGEVVGVVENTRDDGPVAAAEPTIYAAHAQMPVGFLAFVVRTGPGIDPMSLVPNVRTLVAEMDPSLPVFRVTSLEQLAASAVAGQRLLATVVGVFGTGATLLASVGVWAVLGFAVARRRRELGIRLALGARPRDIAGLVVSEGLRWTAVGLGAGLVFAVLAGRALRASLHGVAAHDPETLAAVALMTTLAALVATWAPARRAARTDPAVGLRAE